MRERNSRRKLKILKDEIKNVKVIGFNSPQKKSGGCGSMYKINEKIKEIEK